MKEIRVLVVEDDPDWNEKLVEMYRNLLRGLQRWLQAKGKPPVRFSVEQTRKGRDAVDMLRQGNMPYDLLSLDINLGSTHPQSAGGAFDRSYSGVDGRDLIDLAKKVGCRGLIVITGFAYDDTVFRLYEFDEGNRRRTDQEIAENVRRERVKLSSEIARQWGERHRFFTKDDNIDLTIETVSQELTPEVIEHLCRPTNRFARNPNNPAVWDIVFDDKTLTVADRAGMHFLAQLLREPDRKFSGAHLEMIDPKLLQGGTSNPSSEEDDVTPESLARELEDEIKKLQAVARAIQDKVEGGKAVNTDVTRYQEQLSNIESEIEEYRSKIAELHPEQLLRKSKGRRVKGNPEATKASNRVGRNISFCLEAIRVEEEKICLERRVEVSAPIYDHLIKFYVRDSGFAYKPDPEVDWEVTESSVRSANYPRTKIRKD
jgi:CheY-like chemotaxis protein